MVAFSGLVGFLLVGVVLAHQPFVPGKQYEFSYDGRVASGLIGVSPQYAGVGIRATILCTAQDPENIVVEIREPKIGKLNKKLRSEQAFYQEELPISYRPIEQYARELQTPFLVTMKSGLVTSIRTEEREPTIITNIKRSIASTLQININGLDRFTHGPDMLLPETEDNSQETSFTVMEENTLGICETLYTVSPLPDYLALSQQTQVPQELRKVSPEGYLVVTKTINLGNCIKKATFHHVSPTNEACLLPEANCENSQSIASSTRYLIEGQRNSYILKAAWSEGETIIRPAEVDIKVISHQALQLQSITRGRASRVNPRFRMSLPFDLLTMTPEVQQLDKQTVLEEPIFPLEPSVTDKISPSVIVPQIGNLLEEVANELEQQGRPQVDAIPMKTLTIVKGLQMMNYQNLRLVTKEVLHTSKQTNHDLTIVNVYLECLALTGTNPSILVIKDLLSIGALSGEQASQILMTIPMTLSVPVPEVIEELATIVQLPSVRSQVQVYTTALLTLSQVTYKACINQNISRGSYPVHLFNDEICSPNSDVVEGKVLPLLEYALKTAHTRHGKEVAITALGNIATPKALEILTPYILGSEEIKDVQTRTMAILALQRLAKLNPKEVRQLLIPIISNSMDHYVPRIAAITALLETNPPSSILQQIALMSWFEPSVQVTSYIWTTLKTLSNVTYPTQNATEMAKKSEMALLMAKPVEEGLYYSSNNYMSYFVKKLNIGSLLQSSTISSTDSIFPRGFLNTVNNNIFGYDYSPLQVIFLNEGTQTLVNKLLLPETQRRHSRHPFRFWRHSEPEIFSTIKNHIKKSDLPKGSLHLKLYDAMERIFTYDDNSDFIMELLQQKTMNLEALVGETQLNFQKILPQRDSLITVPSALGLPIVVSVKMPVVLSLKGTIQSDVTPSKISLGTLLRNDPPLNVEVSAEIKPLISAQHLTTAAIVTPFFSEELVSGVEQHVQLSFPGNFSFKLDTSNATVEMEYTQAQNPSEIFLAFHNIRLFTAVHDPLEMKPLTMCKGFKVIHKIPQPIKKTIEFGKEQIGLNFIAKLETDEPTFALPRVNEIFNEDVSLTSINFLQVLRRPLTNQKMTLRLMSSKSSTKAVKLAFQYKSSMLENVTSVENDTNKNKTHMNRLHSSSTPYDMGSDYDTDASSNSNSTDSPSMNTPISTRNSSTETPTNNSTEAPVSPTNSSTEAPVSPTNNSTEEQNDTPYTGALNQTLYATLTFEGSSNKVYEAMISVANYTTTELYTTNVTLGLRMKQGASATAASYYVKSVLQLPVVKTLSLKETIESPAYAILLANVTLASNSTLQIKVNMTRDEEQRRFAETSPESKRCQRNEHEGWTYSYNCTVAKLQATTLNNISVEVTKTGSALPDTLYNIVYNLDRHIKYLYYPYLQVNSSMNSTKPSDVEVYLNQDPLTRMWTIELKKPSEVAYFSFVPQNSLIANSLLPVNFLFNQRVVLPKQVGNEQLYPTCIVQPRCLKTFDNVTVPLKEVSPSCWHVLMKDCSDETKVGVLVRPAPSGKETKIVLGTTEVHIVPSSQQPQVSINSQPINLTSDSFNHPITEYEKDYTVVSVRLLPSGMIEVASPLFLVTVYHDGQNVVVEPSSLYRGRVCGLCGDLNGESEADLKTPDMCTVGTDHAGEFFASWIIPSESCHPYKLPEQHCHRPQYLPTGEFATSTDPHSSTNDRFDANSESPYIFENAHINSPHGRKCESVNKLKLCKPGYKPLAQRLEKVGFFCPPRGVYIPPQFREVNYVQSFPLPVACVRG